MNNFLTFILWIIFWFVVNNISYYIINKRLIKNNIDLFIKKHESQVIHELNNELFKEDLEVLKNEKKGN